MRFTFISPLLLLMLLAKIAIFGQDPDSIPPQKAKRGLNFGALPVIGYNTDIGFQYGLVFNLYNYGDGSLYPGYKYSLYTEFSRTTKGSGVMQVFFDSKHMMPGNLRITADLSYLTELALNFYGYNGYDAVYYSDFEEDENESYISRMFYRHERKFVRFTMDLQGKLVPEKLRWLAGIGYFDIRTGTVNINRLNKNKDKNELLPDTALLFDRYVEWGIIGKDEKEGGTVPSIKTGLIIDTRDQETNPMKGIWTELLFFYRPPLLGNTNYSYLKFVITHRQYFTLVKNDLNLACRLSYQGTLAGNVPFFMEPYMITSFAMVTTTDGLGGAKTLRGILRNRVVGKDIALGNIEVRWKFFRTIIFNQNIYLAVNAFTDAGAVIRKKNIETSTDIGVNEKRFFAPGEESIHIATGIGLKIVLNRNFVVSVDYGKALDDRDGNSGIYAGIGYLF